MSKAARPGSRSPLASCVALRALLALLASGCATPASQIKVPTMSMRQALDSTRGAAPSRPDPIAPTPADAAGVPGDAPRPIITMPDVRLAYLYEWVDAEGNRHFGGWVAIPITPSRWVLSDGATAPLDGQAPPSPVAPAFERRAQ